MHGSSHQSLVVCKARTMNLHSFDIFERLIRLSFISFSVCDSCISFIFEPKPSEWFPFGRCLSFSSFSFSLTFRQRTNAGVDAASA